MKNLRLMHNVQNFYTATVYQKGAEVIRMLQTLVGKGGFRKVMYRLSTCLLFFSLAYLDSVGYRSLLC